VVAVALVTLLILLHPTSVHSSFHAKTTQNDNGSTTSTSASTSSDKERSGGGILSEESIINHGHDPNYDDARPTTIQSSRNACAEDDADDNDIHTAFEAILQAPIPFADPIEEAQSLVRTYICV
jgi:hypothetical protein